MAALSLLSFVGLMATMKLFFPVVECVARTLIYSRRHDRLKRYLGKSSPSYAIITGAASGIGKAFAEEFVRNGFAVLLIDSDAERLNNVSKELEIRSSATVATLAVDVTDKTFLDQCRDTIRTQRITDVAALVNNVGVTLDPPKLFAFLGAETIANMIDVNVKATALLTHLVMSETNFVDRPTKSLMINMASFASAFPMPMLQMYSATKTFVSQLSDALAYEYGNNVDVLCVSPWWVATQMTHISKPNWRTASPRAVVKGVTNYVGQSRHSFSPTITHSLFDAAVKLLPPAWMANLTTFFMLRVQEAYVRHVKKHDSDNGVLAAES